MTTKWKLSDRSDWPVITQEKYAEMLTQIVAGLLASGHYTQQVDLECEEPGWEGLLREPDWRGHHHPCVMEAANVVVRNIIHESGLELPELPDQWEEDTDEKKTAPKATNSGGRKL
jgi:hypothetical protein